ncbi:MAG: hypothetical protein H7338_05155 [Candidatus Sericytochromatia bacterium]|nr:hypothetical protein [Candidatus Sericytochromatia bacterium]
MKPLHAFATLALLALVPGAADAGGQVIVQVAQPLDHLHPILHPDHPAMPLVFTGLFNLDAQDKIVPELSATVPSADAGTMSMSGGNQVLTFRLRSALKWHDGRPITAHDAVFTWQVLKAQAGGTQLPIREAKALDNDRLQLRVVPGTPMASLLQFIIPRHPFRSPAEALDPKHPFWQQPAGSGPFRVIEWIPGKHLRVDAFKDYYRGRPALDQIMVQFGRPLLPSMAKNVQVWTDIPLSWWPKLNPPAQPNARWRLAVTPQSLWEGLRFNLRGPLRDGALRQALLRGIDRKKLATDVFGDAAILAEGVRPHGVPVAFAPSEAKRLWGREAVALRLIYPSGGVHAATAEGLVRQWQAMDVTVQADALSRDTYQATVMNGAFDIALSDRVMGRDDGLSAYHSQHTLPLGTNESGLVDAKLDQLLQAEVMAGGDSTKASRKAAVDARLTELAPGAALFFYPTWHAYRQDLVLDATSPWGPTWRVYTWRRVVVDGTPPAKRTPPTAQ